jgi:hypothetical protein
LNVLKTASEQRLRGNIMHNDQIFHLLKIQKKQLQNNLRYYETSIQNVLNLAYDQIYVIQQDQLQKVNFLKLLMYIKNQRFDESTENIKTKNLCKNFV